MKAIILLSGGIDSAVVLAMAKDQERECVALSFDYGQRHIIELNAARDVAAYYDVPHHIVTLDNPAFAESTLTSKIKAVPCGRTCEEITSGGVPSTYVPARNTLFLAYAVSFAEVVEAGEIHFGANAMDINAYPDCHPTFFAAFQSLINVATKQAIEGHAPRLVCPLQTLDKASIISEGMRLGAPLYLTFSCYSPTSSGTPCKHCDACVLRQEGFAAVMPMVPLAASKK